MSSPNPQHVLTLASDMVKAQNHLAALQAEWDSLFTTSAPSIKRTGTRPTDANSLTKRVVSLLDADSPKHYTVAELVEKFGVQKVQIERTLNRLFITQKIARHERGVYKSIHQGETTQ